MRVATSQRPCPPVARGTAINCTPSRPRARGAAPTMISVQISVAKRSPSSSTSSTWGAPWSNQVASQPPSSSGSQALDRPGTKLRVVVQRKLSFNRCPSVSTALVPRTRRAPRRLNRACNCACDGVAPDMPVEFRPRPEAPRGCEFREQKEVGRLRIEHFRQTLPGRRELACVIGKLADRDPHKGLAFDATAGLGSFRPSCSSELDRARRVDN
jgi:hypothetical protein